MRLTDFWERMESALGHTYARSWASDTVLPELDDRTVMQALGDGVETGLIWRAVHANLRLPITLR